jgi:hypothetical protein
MTLLFGITEVRRNNFVFLGSPLDFVFLLFLTAVQHRATSCPERFPRKLIRVTVGENESPQESYSNQNSFDLTQDRLLTAQQDFLIPISIDSVSTFQH